MGRVWAGLFGLKLNAGKAFLKNKSEQCLRAVSPTDEEFHILLAQAVMDRMEPEERDLAKGIQKSLQPPSSSSAGSRKVSSSEVEIITTEEEETPKTPDLLARLQSRIAVRLTPINEQPSQEHSSQGKPDSQN